MVREPAPTIRGNPRPSPPVRAKTRPKSGQSRQRPSPAENSYTTSDLPAPIPTAAIAQVPLRARGRGRLRRDAPPWARAAPTQPAAVGAADAAFASTPSPSRCPWWRKSLAVAVFVNPGGYLVPPPDITGAEASAWRLIHANLSAVRWLAIALLGLQASSAAAATAIASGETTAAATGRKRVRARLTTTTKTGTTTVIGTRTTTTTGRTTVDGRAGARQAFGSSAAAVSVSARRRRHRRHRRHHRRQRVPPSRKGAGGGAYGTRCSGPAGEGRARTTTRFRPGAVTRRPSRRLRRGASGCARKYGLDTSRFTHDENAPRSGGGGRSRLGGGGTRVRFGEGEGAGRCVVM